MHIIGGHTMGDRNAHRGLYRVAKYKYINNCNPSQEFYAIYLFIYTTKGYQG